MVEKYYGGSYDGFTDSASGLSSLNGGITILVEKYYGGSYDGFTDSASGLSSLNGGIAILIEKYYGGSYDGFTDSASGLSSLNGGITILVEKYYGGSYDGFADSASGLSSLNGGITILVEKYYGGSYDGFTDSASALSSLNGGGITIFAEKYYGGSYDGFADSSSVLTQLSREHVSLQLTALIEGFYNAGLNQMASDTVRIFIRYNLAPFAFVDSAKIVLDSLGNAVINFANTSTGTYYIVIKHRNSIETWSKSGGESLLAGALNIFNFTSSQSQAYGANLVLKGSRWCIYSGDVNQDEVVDGSDLANIDNDASNFTTGYVVTDVNGDQVVDGSDLSIDDNNASNFVAVQKPPGAGVIVHVKKEQRTRVKKIIKKQSRVLGTK